MVNSKTERESFVKMDEYSEHRAQRRTRKNSVKKRSFVLPLKINVRDVESRFYVEGTRKYGIKLYKKYLSLLIYKYQAQFWS